MFAVFTLVMFGAYVGVHLNNLAASALIIGFVFTSRNIIQIFLRVPLSEISQYVGRKPMIIIGMIGYTLALGLLYLADNWIVVLIATLVLGVAMSAHWPSVFAYIGDVAATIDSTSGKNYGKINGIIFQGQDIGIILGALTARYLLADNLVTLQELFGISFIVGIIGIFLAFFLLSEVLDPSERSQADSKISILKVMNKSFLNTMGSFKKLTSKKPLGFIFSLEILVTFTEFFITAFFPLLVVVTLGYDDSVVATTLLVSTSVQLVFRRYFGSIYDKWGYKWPILIALTTTAIMMAILPLVVSLVQLLIVYTIAMSAIFTCFIATTGASNDNVSPKNRGLVMGVLGVYIAGGRTLSSMLLSPILEIFEATSSRADSLAYIFWITSAIIFIAVALLLMVANRLTTIND
jgi:DHA1 family multidrug resistance protein-like MFS transporter